MNTAYATRVLYATSLFYNTQSYNHVDVRVEGSYVIHVGSQAYSARVSNTTAVVKVGGTTVASQTWSGTTSYEWRQTGLYLSRANVISVELTLDLTYTDSTGQTQVLEDVKIVYDSVNNIDKFIDAIAICDMIQGLDFRVSVEDIEEEIRYHSVSYEWRVYNTDGSYTALPAGTPGAPAATGGHADAEQYVYDTGYVTGTSFYDNGLLYTFHGWDIYSHSSVFNTDPSAVGYYALDDGDTSAANNPTIEITADTYIYGYWTVAELPPSSAHIAIEKVFVVDGVEMSLEAAEDLWFRIDTGIDRDGDGDTEINVDYAMIAAAGGEYRIPVYQYDTPFVFTEHNAEVPGYTRTTSITVSGDYITGSTPSGDSVTVTMEPVYQGENIHLGTVTYTNTYTRNVGAPIRIYPELTLVKSAADTNLSQDGVVFTLFAEAECENALAVLTTAGGGLASLDFGTLADAAPGTYYLKETAPLAGYHADPCVYAITLTASEPVEELRGGTYVQVTYHTLSVAVPENSTASYRDDSGYHARPDAVDVILYRDNEPFETVTLNDDNNWRFTWDDLTDEYVWSVDEADVPEGYTKNVTGEGYDFTITNTWEIEYVDVSVRKVWYGTDVVHPGTVRVTLYRDGVAYDSVTLSASVDWSHTWTELSNAFEWTVDEPSVPSGYNKIVRRNGTSFTITNIHENNPQTGDFADLTGMGIMAAVCAGGFGISVLALLRPRKKEEEAQ